MYLGKSAASARPSRLLTILLISAATYGVSDAQSISRIDRVERPEQAERREALQDASVYFRSQPPAGMGEPRLVRDGETAWTEAIFPTQAVRLTAEAPGRRRPERADGVTADTLLFGVHLPRSVAFCQPFASDSRTSHIQCFEDADSDGRFDIAYLSLEQNLDSPYLIAAVQAPTDIAPLPYETIYPQDRVSTISRIVMEVRNGRPTFRRYIDEERLDARYPCRQDDEDPALCNVLGVQLRIEPEGDAFRITTVDARSYREFGVQLSSNRL